MEPNHVKEVVRELRILETAFTHAQSQGASLRYHRATGIHAIDVLPQVLGPVKIGIPATAYVQKPAIASIGNGIFCHDQRTEPRTPPLPSRGKPCPD